MAINVSKEDLYWVAALLEGEGCFQREKDGTTAIVLVMTDLDVVEKYRDIILPGGEVYRIDKAEGRKTAYRISIYGNIAIEWMKLLYPLMGTRRRGKINEILDLWSNRKRQGLDRTMCPNGHDLTIPDNYYLQGNHKACKICAKISASKNIEQHRESVRLYKKNKKERDVIKAIALSRNISIEEAKEILSSALNNIKGGIQ